MSHSTTSAGRAGKGLLPGIMLLAAAAGVFFLVWRTADADGARAQDRAAAQQRELQRASVAAFLKSDAAGVLEVAKQKDMAAVQRALDALRARFKSYGEGIGAFTEALTSWGMRAKIVYRTTVETVERKDEHSWTAALVNEKFAKHVVSDAVLEADVLEVMKQFAFDLEANRNELLASLEAKVTAGALPPQVSALALKDFRGQMKSRISELLAKLPSQSVGVGVGGIAAGIAAEEAVRQIIRVVIAQAATRLAAGAAVSGGAAAGAVAAGGAGGTAVAPGVGTAIGVAGGIIVGAVVDWWMTDEFKSKVAAQCRTFLSSTQVALVTGDKGLEKIMLDCVSSSGDAARDAIAGALHSAVDSLPPPPLLP